MAHSFGDVVLVPFPFTDRSGTKKRPAVIVSSSAYNAGRRDLVIRTMGKLSGGDVRTLRETIAQTIG